ncbi:hypothetical protein [Streptomyces sp. NPDC012746]|uniref:hypothetical protein n=1 Tax=Streptomyces sp. NPDC012746 TaxID=3364845 RepID=UPI0036904FA8
MTTLVQVYEEEFTRLAERKRTWGGGLLIAAAGIWLWLAYLLLSPFSVGYGTSHTTDCDSRVFYGDSDRHESYADAEGERCDAERDWAPMFALLVVSLPLAAIGTFQYTSGTVSLGMTRYTAEKARLAAMPDNHR